MTVLHHDGLHTVQSLGQLDSQEMFAVELGRELEGGTGAVLSSQEQEVALSRAPSHHTHQSLCFLSHVDSQLLPVQDIKGGGHGVAEYRVQSSTGTMVRA